MRKILAGLWFRLLKGYEIWVLIALLLFAGLYIDHSFLNTWSFLKLVRVKDVVFTDGDISVVTDSNKWGVMTYDLYTHNIKDYRFESQGISALDLYRYKTEALSEETSDVITRYSTAYNELTVFSFMIVSSVSIPMVLMMIFIPVFFGRMFSDGTIKNYLACGYDNRKLYLSSLLFTFCIDLFLVFVNLLILGFWCIYYEWKPPFYLPVLSALLLSSISLLFTVTVLCLAILFISRKQTIALIAGLLVAAFSLATIPIEAPFDMIFESQNLNDPGSKEYVDIILSKRSYACFDQQFDYSEFNVRTYYEGRDLNVLGKSNLNPVLKNALLVTIYTQPLLIYDLTELELMTDAVVGSTNIDITPYMMYRDGLIAINIASNIFWISLMSGVVILSNRKREVKG